MVPAGGGGTFLGGFLVNKCRLRGAGVVKLCVLCALTSLLASCVFFVQCPNAPMAGVTASYDGRSGPAALGLGGPRHTIGDTSGHEGWGRWGWQLVPVWRGSQQRDIGSRSLRHSPASALQKP